MQVITGTVLARRRAKAPSPDSMKGIAVIAPGRRSPRFARLILAALTSASVVAGLAVSSPVQAGTSVGTEPDQTAAVEQAVRADLASDGTADFWVYLESSADLAAAPSTSRAAQGEFVYDELTDTADRSQAGLKAMLEAEGTAYDSFWIANTIKVTGGDRALLEQITALPEVSGVTADRSYPLVEPEPAEAPAADGPTEWNIARVHAPQVWDTYGVTGEGIVVGSIDTGVQFDHPALMNQYRGNNGDGTFDHNYNWWDPSNVCGSPSTTPCDNMGHGTHVTGIMVGSDGGDNRIGVAPGAQWIAAKGCETDGCSQEALLSAGQFILAPTDLAGNNPDPTRRPHIVNNSWAGGGTADPWYQPTVQAWVAAGIFPQFASGNPGPDCGGAGAPGNLAEAYSAGAFDIADHLYAGSGRGPSAWGADLIKPNLAAPGVDVRSSVPGGYAAFTGTSMASPHVAGGVALMWSASPVLARDIAATRAILDGTAEDTADLSCGGTEDNNNVWGQGKLDVLAAVNASPLGPVGMLDGTVTDADSGDPITGATITITGEVDREISSGPDGTYSITLPVGDFDVAAAAFGYEPQTQPVGILEGQATTQDFLLAAPDGAHLTLSPSTLDLGEVPIGTTSDPATLTLTSTGADPVTVTNVATPASGFASAGGTCGGVPFTLGRLESCELAFTFGPTTPGAAETTVAIDSNADGPHLVTLQAVGTGILLDADGRRDRGRHVVDLSWVGATSDEVDIHRSLQLLTTTANDGAYTDVIGVRDPGSYAYQVCETGTAKCSDIEMVRLGGPKVPPPEPHFCNVVSSIPKAECRALVSIYETNGGQGWGLGGWLVDIDPCTWPSVMCDIRDGANHVTSLQFVFTPFTGDLAPAVGDLTHLESLAILFSGITGLPDEIGQLTNLQTLAVEYGQLTDIPPTIGQLSSLTYLGLSGQLLTSLPDEITTLHALTYFQAPVNQLTSLPADLGSLTNLQNLLLQWNQIPELPSGFANLSALRELDLSDNPFPGMLPVAITRLDSLELLTMTNAGLTAIPAEISDLQNLRYLQLAFNSIPDLPDSIAQLSALEQLAVPSNQLTEAPTWLGDITSLRFLYLGENQITELPDELSQLTQLELFDVGGNQLTGAIPEWLGTFSQMYTLLLWNNGFSGEVPVALRDGTSLGGDFSQVALSGNGCLTSTVDPTFTQWLDVNAFGWDDGCP
ncbi:MAG: S8 family serine peptidase [Gemmatimonadota bacterium]|nr:S8 family serine peptidase [Gemmatimonadota bacterium]